MQTATKLNNLSKEFPTPSSGDSYARENSSRNIDFNKVSIMRRSLTQSPAQANTNLLGNFATADKLKSAQKNIEESDNKSMVNNYQAMGMEGKKDEISA
jgi:hypothetical protein